MEDMTLEKKILSTNDWGLVALLHEGLIERFEDSIDLINEKDYDGLNTVINNITDILTELIVIFNGEDKLSTNLREIYLFINKTITEGNIHKDTSLFEKSIDIVVPILEGFRELEKNEGANIVSGLTYGKSNLGEYITKSSKTFQG